MHEDSTTAFSRNRASDQRPRTVAPPSRPEDRGRLFYVDDIHELLRGRKSRDWIKRNFAPEFRRKIGRDNVWWEQDALTWLTDSQEAG